MTDFSSEYERTNFIKKLLNEMCVGEEMLSILLHNEIGEWNRTV
jgi:hypothetical protein